MILVFKTDLDNSEHVSSIQADLDIIPEISRWHVDLEDCDRILKVESEHNISSTINQLLNKAGFNCEELT